jgi:coenzyme F420 hydrogenase subunit beta
MSGAASPTLERVLRGQLCAGCGLCAGVSDGAVVMNSVEPGFARPRQLRALPSAVETKIAEACPGSRVEAWPDGGQVDPYWGPLGEVLVGHATDPTARFAGSSGGALTALLVHALQSGMVDRVVQIGPDPDQPTGNVVVISRTGAEIVAVAGSRYAPSSPLEGVEAILAESGRAAFVGKPCDVSALRALARMDPRVDVHIPLMLSFFCAGVPSRRGADRVLGELGVSREDLVGFRYRGEGWPGRAKARLKSGEERSMTYEQSWGGFLADEVQFRCKICPDGVGGAADVACADAWYGDARGYPDFEEREGRSLVISRTSKGQALVDSARAAGAMALEPIDPGEIDRMQPGQTQRKRNLAARNAALIVTLQPRPRVPGLKVLQASGRARIPEAMRNFLGTIRRVVQRRR